MFSACIEPACPTVTRKTLVTVHAIAPAPELVTVEPIIEKAALQPSTAKPPIQRAAADLNELMPEAPRPALTLHFPLANMELTAADKTALDELVSKAGKSERILITSRTDNVGSGGANQRAARIRAQAVRDYLSGKLPARVDAFVVDAQGACCFIASNETPEGRRQNRRVEIVLSAPEPVAP